VQPGDDRPAGRAEVEGVVTVPDMSVVASVQRDIEALAKREARLGSSGLAALALALAREMDAKNSATSKSMCARALAETLERLEALAPVEEISDALDDLAARRTKRRNTA
jgi:hypothetical protein